MGMRTKIFISHATPEDNSFGIWLYSRLTALGYEVWLDKKALLGGEKFWEEIDQVIRNFAIKVLLIYSKNICFRGIPGKLKDGINKEYSLTESIGRSENLHDFLILLNLDDSPPNLFIGSNGNNQIQFQTNWAEGFRQLTKKLEKDTVPKTSSDLIGFSRWYENNLLVKNGIIQKKETYFSSLWPIQSLPAYFYLFVFNSEDEAKAVHIQKDFEFPISRITNILASFSPELPSLPKQTELDTTIKHKERILVSTEALISIPPKDSFPLPLDCQNHFKALLSRVFHQLMKKRGLFWSELSNRKNAYYFTYGCLKDGKTQFDFPGLNKKKRKMVIGRYLSLGKWHFAISSQTILTPFIGFSLKSHIIFTDNGFQVWEDKKKLHSHRRKKGRQMFNEDWRDLLLGYLSALADEGGRIRIGLSPDFEMEMPSKPYSIDSDFGYVEPNSKDRLGVLNDTDSEFLEEPDSINEEPVRPT
jgi:TIR domain